MIDELVKLLRNAAAASPRFRKVSRPDSLARRWDYSAWEHFCVTLSCVREVHCAALPASEELRLDAELGRACTRLVLRALRHRLARRRLR